MTLRTPTVMTAVMTALSVLMTVNTNDCAVLRQRLQSRATLTAMLLAAMVAAMLLSAMLLAAMLLAVMLAATMATIVAELV